MSWKDHIPEDISKLYKIHDYKHAAAILSKEFPEGFEDICKALRTFRFTTEHITIPGGSKRPPAKQVAFSKPKGF